MDKDLSKEIQKKRKLFVNGFDENLIKDLREVYKDSVLSVSNEKELIEAQAIQKLINKLEFELNKRTLSDKL